MNIGDTYIYEGKEYTIINIDLENNTIHILSDEEGYAININN